jgi:dienelactone hydrolase
MVSILGRLSAALMLLGTAGGALAMPSEPCADLLQAARISAEPRALVPEDLVRLRDIGPVGPSAIDARLFTVSPNGRHAAFQLRRADVDTNSYCLAMVVLELRAGAEPHLVDAGGEYIRIRHDLRGIADFPSGMARPITPRWSADSRWFAFLKRVGGRTQIWRAHIDGSGSGPITHSDVDVEDFRIGAGGQTLIYAVRPALTEAYEAIAAEGLSGFRFDDRFVPASSTRPFPMAPIAQVIFVQDMETGAVRSANQAEISQLPASPLSEVSWYDARSPSGRRTWLTAPSGTFFPSRGRLAAHDERGQVVACADVACDDVSRPWWTAMGNVRFVRQEGWAGGSTAIYEWTPGTGAPRRLYVTDDVLVDCEPSGDTLLCLRESSLTPRRLETLDPATGRRQTVFDPNPEFAGLNLGQVERLHLSNALGRPSIADLVLPVGYRPGTRYPLVVVQYDTRGFLRGGTGDDYPIQAFANRGHAVLSVSRPRMVALEASRGDIVDLERSNLAGFDHRRSALSSIEAGVRLAIERGIADPARVGITGMSDGGTIAAFALLHSELFAAVAMSQCCFDETFPARVGPAAARHFLSVGYPQMTERADAFWDAIALTRNAARIRTPILLQISDDEIISALNTYTALREVDAPIDMYVFPDERHVKWQPAHRLAIYHRALDWFDFWLRDIESDTLGRENEYVHWRGWRDRHHATGEPASQSR